ncbi:MAG: triose-phosphate isomerase [Candidatus Gastranaerophilaceae bacterium]|nr:triose-phosphate isomerase [Christensenellales bacterium]
MKRKPIIAGNWKMNMTPSGAVKLVKELVPLVKDADCDVVICPPFVDIPAVCGILENTDIKIGAQNAHWAANGAFTGEISAAMLSELNVSYAIIGHSERRQYFGETDDTVNSRVKAVISQGIIPIICVGESYGQREAQETDAVLSKQITAAFNGIPASDAARCVIAYEPIWAIGTGRTATESMANETIGMIRSLIRSMYGDEAANSLRIQYGGSMNARNARSLMEMPEIDGGLIGGASLKATDFSEIVKAARPENTI